MYKNTVTAFTRQIDRINGDTWRITVLRDVNINMDKGSIVKVYGEESEDTVILNIHCQKNGDVVTIGEKRWYPPKEYQRLTDKENAITFSDGNQFDFFWLGEWTGSDTVADDNYGDLSFYEYMQINYDFVFAITSVGYFSVIPHFEITGK